MTDLIAIMSTLVDSQGRILIEGVYDEVAPLLPEEEQLYKPITFDTVRLIQSHLNALIAFISESLLFGSWCQKNHSK